MAKVARLEESFAADLKRRFDDYRAAFPHRKRYSYPEELRKVLLDAYIGGVPSITLANTVGVSHSALKLWIHDSAPKELPPFEGTMEPAAAPVVCSLPSADAQALVAAVRERAAAAAVERAATPPEATVRKFAVTPGRSDCATVTFPSGLRLELPAEICRDGGFIAALAAWRGDTKLRSNDDEGFSRVI